MIYEIIKSNNWQRPVYFSATVTDDNYIGLGDYLVTEGMARRLVPFKDENKFQFRVDEKLMSANFMVTPPSHSKTPQTGYFFRGLNDPNIFFDQITTNLSQNYRSQYLTLAYYFLDNDSSKAAEVLTKMEENLPRKVIPMDYRILYDVDMLYHRIGNLNKFNELSYEVEAAALEELRRNPGDVQSYYNPYRLLMDIYEARGDYKNAVEILQRLDRISPGSPEIKAKIEILTQKMKGS
ncbi:MAG: tetratricopeptide repeat protein, partial [Ignavibacteria bacterium]